MVIPRSPPTTPTPHTQLPLSSLEGAAAELNGAECNDAGPPSVSAEEAADPFSYDGFPTASGQSLLWPADAEDPSAQPMVDSDITIGIGTEGVPAEGGATTLLDLADEVGPIVSGAETGRTLPPIVTADSAVGWEGTAGDSGILQTVDPVYHGAASPPYDYTVAGLKSKLDVETLTAATFTLALTRWRSYDRTADEVRQLIVHSVCAQLRHGNPETAARIFHEFGGDLETFKHAVDAEKLFTAFGACGSKFEKSLRPDVDMDGLDHLFGELQFGNDRCNSFVRGYLDRFLDQGCFEHALALVQKFWVPDEIPGAPSRASLLYAGLTSVPTYSTLDEFSKVEAFRERVQAIRSLYRLLLDDPDEGRGRALLALEYHVEHDCMYAPVIRSEFQITEAEVLKGTTVVQEKILAAIGNREFRKAVALSEIGIDCPDASSKAMEILNDLLELRLLYTYEGVTLAECIAAFKIPIEYFAREEVRKKALSGLSADLARHVPLKGKRMVQNLISLLGFTDAEVRGAAVSAIGTCLEKGYVHRAIELQRRYSIFDTDVSDKSVLEKARVRFENELRVGNTVVAAVARQVYLHLGGSAAEPTASASQEGLHAIVQKDPAGAVEWISKFVDEPTNDTLREAASALIQKNALDKALVLIDSFSSLDRPLFIAHCFVLILDHVPLAQAEKAIEQCQTHFGVAETTLKPIRLALAKAYLVDSDFNRASTTIEEFELAEEIVADDEARESAIMGVAKALDQVLNPSMQKVVTLFSITEADLTPHIETASAIGVARKFYQSGKFEAGDRVCALSNLDQTTFTNLICEIAIEKVENGDSAASTELLTRWVVPQEKLERQIVIRHIAIAEHHPPFPKRHLTEYLPAGRVPQLAKEGPGISLLEEALVKRLTEKGWDYQFFPNLDQVFDLKKAPLLTTNPVHEAALRAWVEHQSKSSGYNAEKVAEFFMLTPEQCSEAIKHAALAALTNNDIDTFAALMKESSHSGSWLRLNKYSDAVAAGVAGCILLGKLDIATEISWRAGIRFDATQKLVKGLIGSIVFAGKLGDVEKTVKHFEIEHSTLLTRLGGVHRHSLATLATKVGLKTVGDLVAWIKDDAVKAAKAVEDQLAIEDVGKSVAATGAKKRKGGTTSTSMQAAAGSALYTQSQAAEPATVPTGAAYDTLLDEILCDSTTIRNVVELPFHRQQTSYTCATATLRMVLDGVTGLQFSERELMEVIDTTECLGTSLPNFERLVNHGICDLHDLEVEVGTNGTWEELKARVAAGWTVLVNYTSGGPHYSAVTAINDHCIVLNDPFSQGPDRILTKSEFKWNGGYGESVINGGYCAVRKQAFF